MMVPWWVVLVAFWVGGLAGVMTMALMVAARDGDDHAGAA